MPQGVGVQVLSGTPSLEIDMSYSIEVMKRSAFHDELVNIIGTMPPDKIDANIIAVRDYLTKRIKEMDRNYK